MRLPKFEKKRERGSVLAMSALGMLAFLLATGMCVDLGHFYLVKSELQNAADASALAGASALNSGSTGITEAVNRATAAMNSYEFNSKGLKIVNVKFAVNLKGDYMEAGAASAPAVAKRIRFVKVETPSVPVQVFFAAPVLGASKNLKAEATAGMSIPLSSVCDFLPVSVIDYSTPIRPGDTYTFRAAPGGSSAVSPGNYHILAVAGEGGKDVRAGLASGVDACAEPGAEYAVETKPGVTAGPVRVGINTRFDEYGPQVDPAMHPPDLNIEENITHWQYANLPPGVGPSTGEGVPGRRVVIIPIVKEGEYDPGRGVVRFNRFGLFFLKSKVGGGSGGELEAEYISEPTVVGRGGVGTGPAAANGFITKPVLYQ